MNALNDLQTDVGDLTSVVEGGEATLDKLSQMLADALANSNPTAALVQVAAVKSALDATKAGLAASIAKNTPAAGLPPPAP